MVLKRNRLKSTIETHKSEIDNLKRENMEKDKVMESIRGENDLMAKKIHEIVNNNVRNGVK